MPLQGRPANRAVPAFIPFLKFDAPSVSAERLVNASSAAQPLTTTAVLVSSSNTPPSPFRTFHQF